MKIKNSIKCFVFLFAILFSFSVSAFNSANQLYKSKQAYSLKTTIDASSESMLVSDSILVEELENENDSEDFTSEFTYLIPYFISTIQNGNSFHLQPIQQKVAKSNSSLFLSIRALRI